MSGTDNQGNDDLDIDLADFIEETSELFVVMGVFGALAIYIAQSADGLGTSTDSQLMTTVGFVSAFALSLLMLVLIYGKLIEHFGDWHAAFRAHYRLRNTPLALFSLFAFVLVISIGYILTQHEPVIFMLGLIGTYAAGVGLVLRLAVGVAQHVPRTPAWRIPTVFTTCLLAFLATTYLRENVLVHIDVTTIYELSLSDPVTIGINVGYLLIVTVQSFAALGVFATIITIPIVAFDKLRGKSRYNQAG